MPNKPDVRFLRGAGSVDEEELESTDLGMDNVELVGLSLAFAGGASLTEPDCSTV